MSGADGISKIPHREWVRTYGQVLNEVKDTLKKQGREDEFFGSRVRSVQFEYRTNSETRYLDYLHYS